MSDILKSNMPLIILAISTITHLFRFGYPTSVVFDEVHNAKFLVNYWQGNYFFDVHPPLGRLIETFFGYLTGANIAVFDYSKIGNALPDPVILLRIIPVLAGILLPIIVYAILRQLNFSKLSAFTGAMLICLENSLIVQSRFILYDIIMLSFGFASILFYLEYRKRIAPSIQKKLLFITSLIFASLAPGIKWTGLAFVLIIILMELYRLIGENPSKLLILKKLFKFSFAYLGVTLIVYISLFAIHFTLLPKTGTGDAFMSNRFNASLIGNPNYSNPNIKTKNFFGKLTELNFNMFDADRRLTTPHQYSSKWYTWPLETRPIFYWQSAKSTSTTTDIFFIETPRSYIYLLGNPVIYWLGTLSIIILLIFGLLSSRKSKISAERKFALSFITVGYLVNFIPFIFIGRVMFLYHYESALIFSILAIVYILDGFNIKIKKLLTIIILILSLSAFFYWSPLTYGTPLNDKQLHSRMWLSSWR